MNISSLTDLEIQLSALALPRIMASIMENYQKPEGIRVPEAIQKYTGFDIIN